MVAPRPCQWVNVLLVFGESKLGVVCCGLLPSAFRPSVVHKSGKGANRQRGGAG